MGNYLIIGGSSGVGKELVNSLEGLGHEVYATYNKNTVNSRAHVHYAKLDVMQDYFDFDFLPDTLDGLAYCPGSINLKPFHRFTDDDFMNDFRLQAVGATKVIQAVLPRLKAGGESSIVLFSTIAVQNGFNFHSQVAISKGAIEGLTRSLAAELAPEIRVNAIAPSLTNTRLASKLLSTPEKITYHSEKNPLKKVGDAKDVAKAAHFY